MSLNIGITSMCVATPSNNSKMDQSKRSSGQAYKVKIVNSLYFTEFVNSVRNERLLFSCS